MDALSISIGFCGGAVSSYIIQQIVSSFKMKKDKKTIFTYLQSQIPTHHKYISTKNISSHTNLTRSRVEEVCSHDQRVRLSTGEKDGMWGMRQ